MKKITITPCTPWDQMIDVKEEDGPDYPLLKFNDFDYRIPSKITTTSANYPRKTERSKGNVDVLIASTREGWATKCWPFSVFLGKKGEELFDHRHLLKAVKENSYPRIPVAIYERKYVGNFILDSLSDNSVLTLMGLYANATDGTVNAVLDDFVNAVKLVTEEEGLALTSDIVDTLLGVTGINVRYSNQKTINQIKNRIIDYKTKSTKVFNTTNEEQKEWISESSYFGTNNYSQEDGAGLRSKTLDSQNNHRYAGDLLSSAFKARQKDEVVRYIVSSKAEHENLIAKDREDIINNMKVIFAGPVNFFRDKIHKSFEGSILASVTLPEVTIEDLPIEVWAMPQIEGEEEAIQLL